MRFHYTERCAGVRQNARCERKRMPGFLFCSRCRCQTKDERGLQCQREQQHPGAHRT